MVAGISVPATLHALVSDIRQTLDIRSAGSETVSVLVQQISLPTVSVLLLSKLACPPHTIPQVVFHSPSQQHGFNFPFQIGSFDSMSDPPSASQKFSVPVEVSLDAKEFDACSLCASGTAINVAGEEDQTNVYPLPCTYQTP